MKNPGSLRRVAGVSAAVLAALVAAGASFIAALDAGYFRGYVLRFIAAHSGRQIQVSGTLQLHLFSRHPRVIADGVTIANPAWMPAGPTADIGKLEVVFEVPGFSHGFGIARLQMEAATLHLSRDVKGHANWQLSDPDKGSGAGMPLIRSLWMPDAHVLLDDARRHLQFDGSISARDVQATVGLPTLRIDGKGLLNGKGVEFDLSGDALLSVSHDKPYRFIFSERSSDTRLEAQGYLSRPFNFDILDATFDGAGADLRDLYFLTGVRLMNTGAYHLSGKIARRGTATTFSDVAATSGRSDLRATVAIESKTGRPQVNAELHSQTLFTADLGLHAAGRDPEAEPSLILSKASLSPAAVRIGDAAVTFHAHRVLVGRVPLESLAAKMTIDHGVLVVSSLSADVFGGKLAARGKFDARTDDPKADVDLNITDLQLGELRRKASETPPLEGLLRARLMIRGPGNSIHQVAEHANGTLTAVLPRGTIRASLAELTGIDLRGLGLILSEKNAEAGVRCGIASFRADQGILTAQSVLLDTDPVLITGEGAIHLDSESLDLVVRGHPKHVRLARLRSPVTIRGTLSHPSFGIQAKNSVAQTAEAVALGVVLTPLAALLAFVDPGLAKDADCAWLLAAAQARGIRMTDVSSTQ